MKNLFDPPLYIIGEKLSFGASVADLFGFFYREADKQGWSKWQKEKVLNECYKFGYPHLFSAINAHIKPMDEEVAK